MARARVRTAVRPRAGTALVALLMGLVAGCASGQRMPAPVVDRGVPGNSVATSAPARGESAPAAGRESKPVPAGSATVLRPLPAGPSPFGRAPPPEDSSTPPPGAVAVEKVDATGSPAVLALLGNAQRQREDGREALAGASLERALRLEPRNPHLWHELGRLRCEQGRLRECESLCAKSNGLSATATLRRANWRLIAHARRGLGDSGGAAQAELEAGRLR